MRKCKHAFVYKRFYCSRPRFINRSMTAVEDFRVCGESNKGEQSDHMFIEKLLNPPRLSVTVASARAIWI